MTGPTAVSAVACGLHVIAVGIVRGRVVNHFDRCAFLPVERWSGTRHLREVRR